MYTLILTHDPWQRLFHEKQAGVVGELAKMQLEAGPTLHGANWKNFSAYCTSPERSRIRLHRKELCDKYSCTTER